MTTTTTLTVLNSVLQANPCTWCWDWRTDDDNFDNDDDGDDISMLTKIIWDQNRYEDD